MKADQGKDRRYSVVSLFSGCGGMDLGFKGGFQFLGTPYGELPFDIIWANDINEAACATYKNNIGEQVVCADIYDVMDDVPAFADVVIGGFPCQDVSVNGRRQGIRPERSGLYEAMVQVVARCKPRIFVAENVKGIQEAYESEFLDLVTGSFEALGYLVSYGLYLAADFGVPQKRERVFIVGTDSETGEFVHPEGQITPEEWISCERAISDLEDVEEDVSINHRWSRAKPSPDQGNRVLKAARPSDTIRAEHHGNIQFHYRLPRRISMREAARLQSFPDTFIFQRGLRQIERQVGNAVPPVLAWHIANATRRSLQETDGRKVSNQ